MAEITFTPLKHEHAEVQKMHTNLVYYGDSGVVLPQNEKAAPKSAVPKAVGESWGQKRRKLSEIGRRSLGLPNCRR